ncbi:MAG: hypothetical protein FJ224_01335 [Lentisphaerae bacterium]|nr:hypothetical protein [Lentisphaerota bacterium]
MKILAVSAVAALVAVSAVAGPVQQGLYEVHVGANWDVAYDGYDKFPPIQAGLGYYFSDNLQAGGFITFSKKNADSFWGVDDVWGLGIFGEYCFVGDDALVPYVSATLQMLDGSAQDDDTVFVFSAAAGAKFFFLPTVALFGQVNFNAATDEVFDFDRNWLIKSDSVTGSGETTDVSVSAGVRVVLW